MFPSKWPKQMAFHFGARSGSSWRSPSFPSISWPISQGRAARQACVGSLQTGNQGPPLRGLLPAHLQPFPVAVGHRAGAARSHDAFLLILYPLTVCRFSAAYQREPRLAGLAWLALHPTCVLHRNGIFVQSPFRSLLLVPWQHTSHYSASLSS